MITRAHTPLIKFTHLKGLAATVLTNTSGTTNSSTKQPLSLKKHEPKPLGPNSKMVFADTTPMQYRRKSIPLEEQIAINVLKFFRFSLTQPLCSLEELCEKNETAWAYVTIVFVLIFAFVREKITTNFCQFFHFWSKINWEETEMWYSEEELLADLGRRSLYLLISHAIRSAVSHLFTYHSLSKSILYLQGENPVQSILSPYPLWSLFSTVDFFTTPKISLLLPIRTAISSYSAKFLEISNFPRPCLKIQITIPNSKKRN